MQVKSIVYKPKLQAFIRNAGMMIVLLSSHLAAADSINVAVAANFYSTMELIEEEFEKNTGHQLQLISGSSGRHYAQIINGAPFDLFLSADSERPAQLVKQGKVPAENRKPYAYGQLALWCRENGVLVDRTSLLQLAEDDHIAVANTRLAPYGQAALETLAALNVLDSNQSKLVQGENVGQAFQFAYSGNARYAFVALSQVLARPELGSYWQIPSSLYGEIRQEVVLLSASAAAKELFEFLDGDFVSSILQNSGYIAPDLNSVQ